MPGTRGGGTVETVPMDIGGVTYRDPDGREVMFASWTYRAPGP